MKIELSPVEAQICLQALFATEETGPVDVWHKVHPLLERLRTFVDGAEEELYGRPDDRPTGREPRG